MNGTITQFITSNIQDLINTIKEIAPEMWKILVKQIYVEGIGYAIASIGALIILGALFYYLRSTHKKYQDTYKDDDYFVIMFFGTLGIILLFCMFFRFGYNMLARLINPEYYAIIKLLATVK